VPDGCKLTAPNRFVLQWVKDRFGRRIETLAREATGPSPGRFRVADAPAPAPAAPGTVHAPRPPRLWIARRAECPRRARTGRRLRATRRPPARAGGAQSRIHVRRPSSRARPTSSPGPPGCRWPTIRRRTTRCSSTAASGLGKTHLIQAIGHQILLQKPDAKIRYIHAERTCPTSVRAYQHKAFDDFKRPLPLARPAADRRHPVLQRQEPNAGEFFYLFNTLIEAHKQVVITCDKYPKEIEGFEERLISRFGWGLTVALEPPELEMRVGHPARQGGRGRDAHGRAGGVLHRQAHPFERARARGALKRILAYVSFHGGEINLALAKEALRDLLAVQNRQISVENIQKTVADYYKIRVSDMHSKKRSRAVARPRQVAMALAKELTQLSLPEIGGNFGGRDHTTVLHACRQIAKLRESHPDLNHDVIFLLQVLRS
jgi:chromosomal replication initiator protein